MRAQRHNTGKLRLDLLPPEAIEGLASIVTYGAEKYADRDWEKGDKYMTTYASLQRHLLAFHKGIDIDEESGLSHLHHAMANIAFLITYQDRGIGEDDRPVIKKGK
jgi:hypothetical protein